MGESTMMTFPLNPNYDGKIISETVPWVGSDMTVCYMFNTLRQKQNGCHFADNIFKCIFSNENEWISLKISLKLVLKGPINNIPALVQIMAWRRPGNKPLSEPMMVSLPMHICTARPQWVNSAPPNAAYMHQVSNGSDNGFSPIRGQAII